MTKKDRKLLEEFGFTIVSEKPPRIMYKKRQDSTAINGYSHNEEDE